MVPGLWEGLGWRKMTESLSHSAHHSQAWRASRDVWQEGGERRNHRREARKRLHLALDGVGQRCRSSLGAEAWPAFTRWPRRRHHV